MASSILFVFEEEESLLEVDEQTLFIPNVSYCNSTLASVLHINLTYLKRLV